jgi:hypothetical protein
MMKHEAAIPNEALKPFDVFIGTWKTVGTHPALPGITLHGRTSFEWLEGGAFLIMYSEIDEPGVPSGIAIVGSDKTNGEFSMLYFDERGVSRRLEVKLHDGVMTWSRNAPEFSQRVTLAVSSDGRTMTARAEMSKNGPWEPDLELTYTRQLETE